MNRLALMLTAAEAVWLIPFVCGLMFLAAVAVERIARRLAPATDPRDLVDRAHRWGDEGGES